MKRVKKIGLLVATMGTVLGGTLWVLILGIYFTSPGLIFICVIWGMIGLIGTIKLYDVRPHRKLALAAVLLIWLTTLNFTLGNILYERIPFSLDGIPTGKEKFSLVELNLLLGACLIVAIVLFALVTFTKILADQRTRNKLIEKDQLNENVQFLYKNAVDYQVPSSLKWGFVLIGVGAAFIIGQIVPARISEEITIGSIFLLAGIGLVVYYAVARQIVKKQQEK